MLLGNISVLSLSLQKDGLVYAVKLTAKDSSFKLTQSKKYSPEASLGALKSDFSLKNQDIIIAGDSGDLSTVLALSLPKMKVAELQHAIRFSLTSQLPLNPADIYYGYQSRDNYYKIVALSKNKWTFIKNRLNEVKLDAYCPMLACFDNSISMSLGTAEENLEIISSEGLPQIEEFLSNHKLSWRDSPEDKELYYGAIVQGVYALGKDFKKDCTTLPKLPKELQLKHHEWMRYALLASLLYILAYISFGTLSYYSAKDKNLNEIVELTQSINSKTPVIDDLEYSRLQEFDKEFASLEKDYPYSISQLLDEVSLRLPMNCYMRDLRISGSTISCRILSSSGQVDIQEIYEQYKESSYFEDDILITRQSSEVTLTLTILKGGDGE